VDLQPPVYRILTKLRMVTNHCRAPCINVLVTRGYLATKVGPATSGTSSLARVWYRSSPCFFRDFPRRSMKTAVTRRLFHRDSSAAGSGGASLPAEDVMGW